MITKFYCRVYQAEVSADACNDAQGDSLCVGCESPWRRCKSCGNIGSVNAVTGRCKNCGGGTHRAVPRPQRKHGNEATREQDSRFLRSESEALISNLTATVARYYGLEARDLVQPNLTKTVEARSVLAYLLKNDGFQRKEICRLFDKSYQWSIQSVTRGKNWCHFNAVDLPNLKGQPKLEIASARILSVCKTFRISQDVLLDTALLAEASAVLMYVLFKHGVAVSTIAFNLNWSAPPVTRRIESVQANIGDRLGLAEIMALLETPT